MRSQQIWLQALTQSLLNHVHNNANISFQLELDQALVQESDKIIWYLFEEKLMSENDALRNNKYKKYTLYDYRSRFSST